jgi:hypothetical protein
LSEEEARVADYGRELEFGISIVPTAATVAEARAVAEAADRLGRPAVTRQRSGAFTT